MQNLFETVLDASFSGSIVIIAVMILRILIKKAPRSLFCILWILAGLRLVLPFEIESSFSLQPRRETVKQSIVQQIEYPDIHPQDTTPEKIQSTATTPAMQPQFTAVLDTVTPRPQWNRKLLLPSVWMAGMIILAIISIIRYGKLKQKVRQAWRTDSGCWESEMINTAFVLGYLPPKIYLPANLGETEKQFITAHERVHIARCDHWTKLLGYIVLMIHWFNPLVWIGYGLLCRDMEYACDARVVRGMNMQQRKEYTTALLLSGSAHRSIAAYPVSFAESDPKGRIRAVLNYKRPGFWVCLTAIAAVIFVALCLLTSPESQLAKPEIPSLTYHESLRTFRLAERFNPTVQMIEAPECYKGTYATYYFEASIPDTERDGCVFYAEKILSRFELSENPDIVFLADYDGAWIDTIARPVYYIGCITDPVELGAELITLLCGEYTNYGAAYGYADYIAVSEGWKHESADTPNLTQNPARDMNRLCFREEFVSAGEIRTNKNAAASFAHDYIDAYGEEAYRNLLVQSGDPEMVSTFNMSLSAWYAGSGLEYAPSEILYAIGGSYHDYLVKCPYATFYLPKDWDNAWESELTNDSKFLHKDYTQVKTCFETNAYQMGYVQQSMGFDSYNYDLTVEFMYNNISHTRAAEQRICINSIEDLPMMYVYYITLSPLRTRDYAYARIDSSFYIGMAKYIAINNPNLYESQQYFYIAKHGEQAGLKEDLGWNDNLLRVLEGESDPYQLLKKRWDFISYFYDDYYDKPGDGLACSLPLYLIDKYGYETMFNYIYITGKEPITLDLVAERDEWIAYLEETYKDYPKYSDYAPINSSVLYS